MCILLIAFSLFLLLIIVLSQQLASHGLFDVHVKATGDLHIDDHHTNEDVALAIGTVTCLCDSISKLFYFSFVNLSLYMCLFNVHKYTTLKASTILNDGQVINCI